MSRTKKFLFILKLYSAISQPLLCILKHQILTKPDFAFDNARKNKHITEFCFKMKSLHLAQLAGTLQTIAHLGCN